MGEVRAFFQQHRDVKRNEVGLWHTYLGSQNIVLYIRHLSQLLNELLGDLYEHWSGQGKRNPVQVCLSYQIRKAQFPIIKSEKHFLSPISEALEPIITCSGYTPHYVWHPGCTTFPKTIYGTIQKIQLVTKWQCFCRELIYIWTLAKKKIMDILVQLIFHFVPGTISHKHVIQFLGHHPMDKCFSLNWKHIILFNIIAATAKFLHLCHFAQSLQRVNPSFTSSTFLIFLLGSQYGVIRLAHFKCTGVLCGTCLLSKWSICY